MQLVHDPTRNDGPEELPGLVWSVAPGTGVTVVRLSGELDVATAPLLRPVLSAQIQAARTGAGGPSGDPDVLIDLSALTFCDLHGLATLRWARDQATAAGGHLEVLHPSGLLQWVADVCGVADLFAVRA